MVHRMEMTSREMLTTDRTFYVRSDGDDANDGLSDSPAGAFRTFQRGVNVISRLDFGGHDVTLIAGDEAGQVTFVENVKIGPLTGGGVLYIRGSGSARTTITSAAHDTFTQILSGTTAVSYSHMRLESAATGVKVAYISIALFGEDICFGDFGENAIWVHDQQAIAQILNCSIHVAGSMKAFLFIQYGHAFVEAVTLYIWGSTVWRTAFITSYPAGTLQWIGNTIAGPGSATGSRVSINHRGVLNLAGRPVSDLPGSSDGLIDATSAKI